MHGREQWYCMLLEHCPMGTEKGLLDLVKQKLI